MTQNRPDTDEKPTAFAAFEPVLKRWTTAELEQAARDVQNLVAHPGYQVLHRAIKEKHARELVGLIHGVVLPQANYAAITSMLSGLDQVLHVPECVQYMAERRDQEEREAARQAAQEEDAA